MDKEFCRIPDLDFYDWENSYCETTMYALNYIKSRDNDELKQACFSRPTVHLEVVIKFNPIAAIQLEFLNDLLNNIKSFKKFSAKQKLLPKVKTLAGNLIGMFDAFIREFKKENYIQEGSEELKYEKFKGYKCWSLELDYNNRLIYIFNVPYKQVNIVELLSHYKAKPLEWQDVQKELIQLYNSTNAYYDGYKLVHKYNTKYNK